MTIINTQKPQRFGIEFCIIPNQTIKKISIRFLPLSLEAVQVGLIAVPSGSAIYFYIIVDYQSS
jgi:hypothetical protein